MTQTTQKNKIKLAKDQFKDIEDKDLRCRNIATMILNYKEDYGDDVAYVYATQNVVEADELHVREWILKLAKERGYETKEFGERG